MPAELDLLQAVLENPDDDGPRLAYAEWCAGRADQAERARAELVRTQIEIFRMPYEALKQGDAATRQTRVFELLEKYGAGWAGQLRELVADYQFQRGFVGLVRMTARGFLDHAAELFALAPIQHLDLTGVRDVGEELFLSPHLGRLRSLSLDGCGLYNIHLQLLAASPESAHLRWLSVADNHLEMEAAEALARSEHVKQLRYADFRGNPFDPTERLGMESGEVIASWLPEEGKALEKSYGYLPWLHRFEDSSRFE